MARGASECDVMVIGAGPAGAVAGHLLSCWGRSVIVAHRESAAPALAESLPASTRKLLRFLGQLDAVDAAGFYPNDGNIADWAGAARVTTSANAGFHVSRRAFDAVLRASAGAAGAHLVDAVVRRIDGDDPIRVTCTTAGGETWTCHARVVLDCSGRAGVIARRGLRRREARYRTLAIIAEWNCAGWPAHERTHTTVESYPDGWAWSVPLSDIRRQCTVMIDPSTRHVGADRRVRPGADTSVGPYDEVYGRELAKATGLSARLAGARQISAPWTCDASLYDATRAADGGVLLVGDAASFIEPLSSAGVKKALLSAWRAAVVANTCLGNPAMAGAAIDLFGQRERQIYAECLRRSIAFFSEAALVYNTPFWSARTDLAETAGAIERRSGDEFSDEELARDRAVRTVFDRLQQAPPVRLRSSSGLRFVPAPAIEGREVVMRDALVVPGSRVPLQFAAGVNLPALARLAGDGSEVPALIAAYQTRIGPVPVGGLLTGLSLLVARRALVTEDSTS